MQSTLGNSIKDSETLNESLYQEKYLENEFRSSPERRERIHAIANDLGPMDEKCQFSVCIPAYQEAGIIGNTLRNYTLFQTGPDANQFDPNLFEINILVNRPNSSSKRDVQMLEEIQQFRSEHPEYQINVAEIVYDFPKKPIIGLIFKDIVDAVLLRNLSRNISEVEKSRLILRTAGADVEALNPLFIARTLSVFSDPRIVAHRGETRLPPELLQSFPLLHVMQTLAVFLLRQYYGAHTTNGPFSYTAEAYASVGGFDPEKALGEEIDLAHRIWRHSSVSEGKSRFTRDCVKDVLNNPRRQVQALLSGSSMAARYQNFGATHNEEKVRDMSTSWRDISSDFLPDFCHLTPENLSREVSAYYRTYVRMALSLDTSSHGVDTLFKKGFRRSGIVDYTIHRDNNPIENRIDIYNIHPLVEQMQKQTFSWIRYFGKYPQGNK